MRLIARKPFRYECHPLVKALRRLLDEHRRKFLGTNFRKSRQQPSQIRPSLHDRLKLGALAKILTELKQSNADVVYGDYDFIDTAGGWTRYMKVPRWSKFIHIHHHCYVPSTAAFYRNSTIIVQGYRLREDFRYVMDGEFYARLDSAGKKFQHVALNIADFRMHGGNASQRHLVRTRDMDTILAAERQHVESRAIRRAYGITVFNDPYLEGLVDGVLFIVARGWKAVLKLR